jgi:hypothetical protein
MEEIPYKLIEELMKKMSVKEWIALYEKNLVPKQKRKKFSKKPGLPDSDF